MQALSRLAPKEWLSDEIVNSMLILLPPVDHVLILDSLFFSYAARGEWERLHKHNLVDRNGSKLFVCSSSLTPRQ